MHDVEESVRKNAVPRGNLVVTMCREIDEKFIFHGFTFQCMPHIVSSN
jgi:hypothetical protein